MNDVEERCQPVDFVQLTRQRRGQIEAETVYMHIVDPVTQAVHDKLQHLRVAHVEAVAGAGVVEVIAPVVGHEPVVGWLSMPRKLSVGPRSIPSAVWL